MTRPLCDFCLSRQPAVASPRSRRLGRQVRVCWRHVSRALKLTRREREQRARMGVRMAGGG